MPNGYVNITDATRKLAAEEVVLEKIENSRQKTRLVSESGLYRLIGRSDKPEARKFQDWVNGDVLPAIRKDGAYILGEEKVATGEMSEDDGASEAVPHGRRSNALTVSTPPVVHAVDGVVFANSRDVAAFFGKRHDNVLRDIDAIINANNLDAAAYSSDLGSKWFRLTTVEQKTGFGVRQVPAYDMTREGFTLLVMGYTGPRAMEFKVRYIRRFNEMEVQLRQPVQPALPDFSNPAEAARAWADQFEQRQVAEEKVKALTV